MIQGFYSAGAGVKAHQETLDIIANNLANINTVGFTPSRASFRDLLYTNMRAPASHTAENLKTGAGATPAEAARLFQQNAFETTGRALDCALSGDGFFAVQQGDQTVYTRAGAFAASVEGQTTYLVTTGGAYVLSAAGQRIELTAPADQLVLGGPGNSVAQGMIELRVVKFANPYALTQIGDGLYAQTELSGEPVEAQETTVIQRALELSGVDTGQELTRMIMTQRAYSMNARALQTADDLQELTLSMKR